MQDGFALEARCDSESDVMVLESDSPANWPHGTTVDGLLTHDLDEDRIVVHAELMWPRARWPDGTVELADRRSSPATLRLPNLSTERWPSRVLRTREIACRLPGGGIL